MDPLTIGLGVAKAGMGIMSAISGRNAKIAQARAQNEAAVERYKYQLKIRERENLNQNQLFATKLSQYIDLGMKAADRAAARAYGVEGLKESQRIKSALVSTQKLNRAMTKATGLGVASGKQGRSSVRDDRLRAESKVVESRNMIMENLMGAEAARQYREMGITDQLSSARNRAFSAVAIAPTVSEPPLEPAQLSGPGSAGMMLGIGSSILDGVGSIASGMAPDPGDISVPGPEVTNSLDLESIDSYMDPSYLNPTGSSFFGEY
tara:strand:+ start:4266 stop:5057 length:792 start_codon:yes stop_codon:yes gene_type:complete